jgi:ADP-ribose pyrophosphatase YjhB (NUDIX family)
METSAGIILTFNKKILVCHPTNASLFGTWSIPKGHIEEGEELIEAAYRETLEEIGVKLDFSNIDPDPIVVEYKKNGSSKVYKQIICFHYEVRNLANIGLTSEILPHSKLQLEEIDFAAFLDKENLDKYLFWRLQPILKFIE